MRKLLAGVGVLAVLALALLACGCGGGSSISTKEVSLPPKVKTPKVKPVPMSPSVLPKVNGKVINIEGFLWLDDPRTGPIPESLVYTKRDLVSKPKLVRFVIGPENVRVKVDPKAKIILARFFYAKGKAPGSIQLRPFWDGKDLIPLTKTYLAKDGKQRTEKLIEVSIRAYDPRFLSPPHTYPGVVDIPPGATHSVG